MAKGDGQLRRPGVEHRLLAVGSTGSGKTTALVYHLSNAPFDQMPYTIIDSKREKEFQDIPHAIVLDHGDVPRTMPGLYIFRIDPGNKEDLEALDDYFAGVHRRGNHGLLVDEGYSVYPSRKRGPLTNILTQGRSLHIPVLMGSQRPANIGVEALSEATFFQVYNLTRPDDRKTMQEYIPASDYDFNVDLPMFHSVYRDAAERITRTLPPTRLGEKSVAEINRRLDLLMREKEGLRPLDAGKPVRVNTALRAI
jgi:GTPase SAR1 family protein